jgi:purine-nucleoside phosphorylase
MEQNLRGLIDDAVGAIRKLTDSRPQIGIVLGTGLGEGSLTNELSVRVRIPYEEIPHFPHSTVESHAGNLILGTLRGREVAVMSGRVHFYEGYTMREVTLPIRALRGLGAETMIMSSAVGGMNPLMRAGEIVCIVDHINLMGDNPLIGENDDSLGPRFPDMSEPYALSLVELAERTALRLALPLNKGVLVGVAGPNLETRAEYRFLRALGADVVGMSMVPETIAAVHGGMRVLGLSVITDECLPDALKPVDIQEILRIAGEAEPRLARLVCEIVPQIEPARPQTMHGAASPS